MEQPLPLLSLAIQQEVCHLFIDLLKSVYKFFGKLIILTIYQRIENELLNSQNLSTSFNIDSSLYCIIILLKTTHLSKSLLEANKKLMFQNTCHFLLNNVMYSVMI